MMIKAVRVLAVLIALACTVVFSGVAIAEDAIVLYVENGDNCEYDNVWLGSSHPAWDWDEAVAHVSEGSDSVNSTIRQQYADDWSVTFDVEDLDDESDISAVWVKVRMKGSAQVWFKIGISGVNEQETGAIYCYNYPAYNDFEVELDGSWTDEDVSDMVVTVSGDYIAGYGPPTLSEIRVTVIQSDVHGAPAGSNPGAGDVQDYSADLRGFCSWDGNPTSGDTLATFYWWNEYQQTGSIEYEVDIDSDETFTVELETLPLTNYLYHFVMTNVHGNFTSSQAAFKTEEATTGHLPTVQSVTSEAVWREDIEGYPDGTGWANLVGRVLDDGGQPCLWGFAWREMGEEDWLEVEFDEGGQFRETGQTFAQNLVGFQKNTSYEWKARARNSIGIAYGEVLEFAMGSVPGVPVNPTPPNGGGVPIIPDDWNEWLSGLGTTGLALLGIVLTVLACIGVGKLRVGSLVIAVCAIGCVVAFTVLGWFPGWIIILGAIGLGLGIFYMLTRGGG